MPHGFFTVEQWKSAGSGGAPQWAPVKHFDACNTLTKAIEWIEAQGNPGFYRIAQTQRVIWAEESAGTLRLRKWHAGSLESLQKGAAAFDRDGGKYPVAKRSSNNR